MLRFHTASAELRSTVIITKVMMAIQRTATPHLKADVQNRPRSPAPEPSMGSPTSGPESPALGHFRPRLAAALGRLPSPTRRLYLHFGLSKYFRDLENNFDDYVREYQTSMRRELAAGRIFLDWTLSSIGDCPRQNRLCTYLPVIGAKY